MNILFVCRYNKFRSKIAEAYFKKLNNNKSINVRSAGIFPSSTPLDKLQVRVAKKFGIKPSGRSKPVSTDLLRWQDRIIVVTDDFPKGLFNYGPYNPKVVIWKIKDEMEGNEKETENITEQIMKKVEELNKELNEK